MIKPSGNLEQVKEDIKNQLNKEVSVVVNLGRNKFAEYSGKITNVYPALFTVTPTDDFNGKTSFSYFEVMCKNVVIKKLLP